MKLQQLNEMLVAEGALEIEPEPTAEEIIKSLEVKQNGFQTGS